MASEIDDGGPAFPRPETTGYHPQSGMTLRDYFAAIALPWALANRDVSQPWKFPAAMAAYEVADAMLTARNQPPTTPSGESS